MDVVKSHVADEPVPVGRIAVPLVKVSAMSEERRILLLALVLLVLVLVLVVNE